MPVDVHVDKKNGCVHGRVTGIVTAEEMIASFAAVLDHPEFDVTLPILIDMTGVTQSLSAHDVRRLADYLLARGPAALQGAREAVVVSRPASYGMVRMFQSHLEASGLQLRVFYDVDEARNWLGAC
jgi:hypothetical protein